MNHRLIKTFLLRSSRKSGPEGRVSQLRKTTRCEGCGRAYQPMSMAKSQSACPNCRRTFAFAIEPSSAESESRPLYSGERSKETVGSGRSKDEGGAGNLQRRISTKCKCGETIDMPMAAIDLTIGCLNCGEKITLTSEEVRAKRGESRREPRAVKGMEELGLTPYPGPPDDPIGELLVSAGMIDKQQLREALSVQAGQGGKLAEVLIQLRHIDRDSYVDFLGRLRGVRSIAIKNYSIENDTLGLIPYEFALDREVCPIERLGPILTMGMACPLDSKTIADSEDITGLTVMPYLCTAEDIAGVIIRFHPSRELTVFDDKQLPMRETRN